MKNNRNGTITRTDRLLLREVDESDAEFMNRLLNTPKFLKYIGDRGVRTDEEARVFIRDRYRKSYADNGYGLYLVELTDGQQPIGMCGFVRRETLLGPDLGFAFLPEHEAKGYGFESATAAMKYGRTELKFNEVFAITTLDNIASIALLKKLGFSFKEVMQTSETEKINLFHYVFP